MRYGVFCLGTCWAIMLVMFGIGMKSLLWMVVLAGFLVLALVWALLPLAG